MFHKGSTKEIADRIARALGGVRTSGAGYNIQTTKPAYQPNLPGLNKGGIVPGTGNTDTYHTTAEAGAFVINKAGTEANMPVIENLLGGRPVFRNAGGQVPVVLTPGEAVIPADIAKDNMPLMYDLNGGPGNTSGMGRETGGGIRLERSHLAEGTPTDLKKVRSTKGFAHAVSVSRGIPIWMTRDANQETRSVGRGMTGPELVKEFRKAIKAGHHPFEPWMTASDDLGGDPKNKAQFNKVFNEMLKKLEKDTRIFGGKNGDLTFEKWFQKEILPSKSFSSIRVGNRSFKSIFNSVLQPMGPRDGKEVAALRTLINGRNGLTTIEKSRLSAVAKGLLGTFSGKSYNSSRQALAQLMARVFLKRNAGGMIPGQFAQKLFGGGRLFLGMPRTIKQVEAQRAAKAAMDKASQAVENSRFKKSPVTSYDDLLEPTSGRSFPVAGIGGLYSKGGEKVFVKPVLDEKAALAELRATTIAREVHGLDAPKQKIVVMKDPTDPTGKRKLLALESKYDEAFANQDGKFTTDQYFRQLVASALRGDKDLGRGNLSGNILADVGTSGVFSTASGLREYSAIMPTFKHQAMINLLGVKGSGAKKFFAESTSDIPKGMTADQYNNRMLKEINEALPKLKNTVSRFDLNAEEQGIYNNMIERLSTAKRETYQDLYSTHLSLTKSSEKTMTPAALAKIISADELKRRQKGVAASLSDNDFKTEANGFNIGGMIGNVLKGRAMHKIGAGFGPTGEPKPSMYESAPWGVNSLSIDMANKLFANTGLRKHTQKLFYDKFAAALAKEKPYGYVKDAKGSLKNALEPDVLDSVIRSAASDMIGDRAVLSQLSPIDKDILRKKYLNWDSKKDTPMTEALKKLIFEIQPREMGGPVNSGKPYLVGEKGPEIFVPRNNGGIVPNTAIAIPPQGYALGGGILAMSAIPAGAAIGAQLISQKVANPIAQMIIQQVGFILPMIMMNSMMMNRMQSGAKTGGMMSKLPASLTTPIGMTSKLPGGAEGPANLTKYGKGLTAMSASGKTIPSMLAKIGFAATRLNIGLAVLTTALMIGKNRFDAYKESMRLNALGFGMTAEGAEKAGLKFTDYNKKIKDAISDA